MNEAPFAIPVGAKLSFGLNIRLAGIFGEDSTNYSRIDRPRISTLNTRIEVLKWLPCPFWTAHSFCISTVRIWLILMAFTHTFLA